mgnify:CR=1 FL=1
MGEKGRFVLPTFARKKIREASEGRVLCIAKHDKFKCLTGFGLSRVDAFQQQIDREEEIAIRTGAEFDRDTRASQLFGFAEISFDDSGRFILPDHLIALGGVEDGLYFHGAGEFMTIWNPAHLADMGSDWEQAKVTCESLIAAAEAKAKKK